MRVRLPLLAAIFTLLLPLALRHDVVAAPLAAGLSEQDPDLLSDFRVRALPFDHARLVVPWDVAFDDPGRVDRWLAAARAARMSPLVAFEHSAGDRCPDTPCTLPTDDEYRAALTAFGLRWPAVAEWTPWNEPNHPSQPTAGLPRRAAEFYNIAAEVCPACTMVAGDLVDSASMKGYLRDYRATLAGQPSIWGIHNYGDVTYPRAPYTLWLLDQVAGDIWITETGGIVRLTSGGQDLLPFDVQRAAASVDKAFALAAASPRITRMYFYNWRAAPWEAFDAGLTDAAGGGRPALDRLFLHLGTRPPGEVAPAEPLTSTPSAQADDARPTTATQGAGRSSSPTTAAPSLGRRPARLTAVRFARHGIQVRIACPARRRCDGRLLVDAVDARGRLRRHLGSAPLRGTAHASWVLVRVDRARLRPRGAPQRRVLRVIASLANPSAVTVRHFHVRVPAR
jgi:hypothetical protein